MQACVDDIWIDTEPITLLTIDLSVSGLLYPIWSWSNRPIHRRMIYSCGDSTDSLVLAIYIGLRKLPFVSELHIWMPDSWDGRRFDFGWKAVKITMLRYRDLEET